MLFFNVNCPETNYYTAYKPVFMDRTELENSVQMVAPTALNRPAKIYTKDGFLFISESFRGIHVINNSDPANPVKMGFIKVVGCLDMAIKGTTLYVDNATDLVSIDMTDAAKPVVTKRIKDVFPEPEPPDHLSIPNEFEKANRPANLVIVDWVKK